MIFHSPSPAIDIPIISWSDYFLDRIKAYQDKVALIDGESGKTTSFAELNENIHVIAKSLQHQGYVKGDIFAIYAPNHPEYVLAFQAILMLGGIVTTVNPLYTSNELEHQLQHCKACCLLTTDDLLDKVNSILSATSIKQVFVFGASTSEHAFACLLQDNKAIEFKPVSINPQQDIAVLPYSSGTTGLAKGVMLSHYNLVAHNIQLGAHKEASNPNKQDRMIAVLPFFHIFGMAVNMNLGLSNGATLVIVKGFKPKQFLSLIEQYQITRAYLVPPIILFLAENPVVADYDVSSLQYILSGAAPLGEDLVMTVKERVGCMVCQGYGLTETSPATHWTPDLSLTVKPSSVGTLVPNTEAMIIDSATGKTLGYNEAGEILLRGPQVMLGYLYNLEATAATLDSNGWLHTGDVASVDEEGYFYIIDRLKELIKCRGFQVAPAELEQLLLTHPAIADVAVIPKLDKRSGEVPKAFVVTKQEISADEIINWAAKKVASYKRIKEIEFVDQIPKSPSGKILRRLLRNR